MTRISNLNVVYSASKASTFVFKYYISKSKFIVLIASTRDHCVCFINRNNHVDNALIKIKAYRNFYRFHVFEKTVYNEWQTYYSTKKISNNDGLSNP